MPGENIQDWSTTAASNSNADSSINWAEGQPRASVNNSSRAMMAAHAKDRNLRNGSIVTAGTANAQTFFSGLDYTSVPTGLRTTLKIGPDLTNTAAATLNMDNIGAVAIKNQLGLDIAPGTLVAGGYGEFIYNGTNWIAMAAAAGVLENIRVFTATGTYPTTASTCKVLVYVKGGGGGGGGGPDLMLVGGGGGEGEEAWRLTTAVALSGQTMTIGAGGAQALDGLQGGTSSAGALCAAGGGYGGTRAVFGGQGGHGGFGGGVGGAFQMPGACGHTGCTTSGGAGGTIGIYAPGGGKGGGAFSGAGLANSGGGGGGGSGGAAPGNGGSGVIVCYEYGII